MKTHICKLLSAALVLLTLLVLDFPQAARGQSLIWNDSETLWDATSQNWTFGVLPMMPTAWVPDSNGTIGGADFITVVGTQQVGTLTLSSAGGKLSGGTLAISAISLTPGAGSSEIASAITSPRNLTLTTGGASLYLTGTTNVTGTLAPGASGYIYLSGAGASVTAGEVDVNGGSQALHVQSGATLTTPILTEAGGNIFIDGASVNAGTVVVEANFQVLDGGILTASNVASVQAGGTLTLNGGSASVPTLSVGGSGVTTNVTSGMLTVAQGLTVGKSGGGALNVNSGGIVNIGQGLTVGQASDGTLDVNAGGTVNVTGNLQMGTDTSHTSNVVVASGGLLSVGGGSIYSSGGSAGITLYAGGILRLTADTTSSVAMTLVNSTYSEIDTNGHNATFSGTISGTGGSGLLEKAGAGILKLTGNNNYGALAGTEILGGLIEFSTLSNLSLITAGGAPNRTIFLNGGGLRWATGNTLDISNWISSMGANGATFDTNGNNVTLATSTGYRTLGGVGGPITKTGAGTLKLTADVTRTGATMVNGGTLSIAGLSKIGTGPVNLLTGGVLSGTANLSFNSAVTIDGAPTALLAGTYLEFGSGGNGSVAITNGGSAAAVTAVTVGNAGTGTASVTGANSTLFAGSIFYMGILGGTGTLSVGGGGTVSAGQQLRFGDNGGTSTFNLNTGGTLLVGGTSGIFQAGGRVTFNLAGGTVRVTGAALTTAVPMTITNAATIDTNGLGATFSAILGGPGSLAKVGAGTLALAGTDTFSGGFSINAGTASIVDGSLGTGPVSVSNGAKIDGGSANVNFNQAVTVDGAASQITTTGYLQVGTTSPASLSLTNGATVTTGTSVAFGLFSTTGTGSITGSGSSLNLGTVLFLAAYGGTGAVSVGSGGNITAMGGVRFGVAGGTGTLNLNPGGTLQVGGTDGILADAGSMAAFNFAGGTLQVIGADLTSSVPMTLSGTSTLNSNGYNATLTGALTGSGSLTKLGAGALTLGAANNYSGFTRVDGGTLALASPASQLMVGTYLEVGSSANGGLSITGGGSVSSPSTVAFGVSAGSAGTGSVSGTGSSLSAATTFYVGFNGAGKVSDGAGGLVTAGNLVLGMTGTGEGTFNLNTGGTLNVGGANGIAVGSGVGTFNLAGGTIKVTGSALTTPAPMTLANSSLIDTSGVGATLSGLLSGAGSLTKTGAGTLSLSNGNSYSGTTTVLAGTISVASASGVGTGPVSIPGGMLSSTGSFSADRAVTIDGAGSSLTTATYFEAGSSGTGSLAITNGGTLSATSTVAFGVAGGTSGTGSVTGTNSALTAGSMLYVGYLGTGTVSVGSGGTITAPTLALGFGNTGHGTFNLNSGGTLLVGGTNGILLGDGAGVFNFAGGTLKVTNSSLTTAVPMTLANSSLVDTSGVDATFSGALGGSGGLSKTGGGTLHLGAANTYAGGTTLIAGGLAVNNSTGSGTGSGPVTIDAGATLSGSFTISGAASVNGLLAPGNGGIGAAIFNGDLALGSGSVAQIQLASGTSFDTINVGGTLTLDGTVVVTTTGGYTVPRGARFQVIGWSVLVASGFNPATDIDLSGATTASGVTWDTSSFLTTGTLVAIPEPGAFGLAVAVMLGAMVWVRRRSDF